MEEGLDNIPQNPSADAIEELYLQGTNYLKTRVGFVFENPKLHPRNWTIATWAKNVKRSVILTKGTSQDKANLPEESRFNRGHTGRKRQVNLQPQTRVPRRRVEQAAAQHVKIAQHVKTTPTSPQPRPLSPPSDDDNDSFANNVAELPPATMPAPMIDGAGSSSDSDIDNVSVMTRRRNVRCQNENRTNLADAFGLTILSNTARARATEIELQVQQEMAEERNASVEESRRRRNVSEVIV